MAIAWGDFESMALHYLNCLGAHRQQGMVFFCRTTDMIYAVGTDADYEECVEVAGQAVYRPVMSMTAEEFIGLLLIRFNDIVEVVTNADVEESIQAGDEPGGESAGVDAGTGGERAGKDAFGGSEAGETHKAVPESGETEH